MIDHISIYVNNLVESRAFYEKAFAPLGYHIIFGEPEKFWAFDVGKGMLFEIMQYKGSKELTPCHVAFRVSSQEQVNAFYDAAINSGGSCNGKPGPRPEYTENYYAAFVLDLNGNNVEAVFDSAVQLV